MSMNPELLSCHVKRFLCPICGKWHNWNSRFSFSDGEVKRSEYGKKYKIYLSCDSIEEEWYEKGVFIKMSFYASYNIVITCNFSLVISTGFENEKCIYEDVYYLYDFKESETEPRVYLLQPFAEAELCTRSDCEFSTVCIRKRSSNIQFALEFDYKDYE